MNILNLFKKKTEQEQITSVTPTNPKYKEEIALLISYSESTNKLMHYKTSQMLTANDMVDYREQRNAIFKGFQQTIDKIHADIKDNPSDPMLMIEDKTFLIKKSDFINAKVVITSYHKDDSVN
jgi:hypothetical protein